MTGTVVAVAARRGHHFSKTVSLYIRLVEGLGVEGDAHAGATVRHRSRVRQDPTQPNLRQVHLIHAELFDELAQKGYEISPGDLGENITTRGVDLLSYPVGTRLQIGDAVIQLTGLRNPCVQIDSYRPGLMQAVLDRAPDGSLIRKCGVMGIVKAGGEIQAGDSISATLPPLPHVKMDRV